MKGHGEKWLAAALVAGLAWMALGRGRGGPSAAFTETDPSTWDHPGTGVPAHPGCVYTAHRYPARPGAQITTAIHHGLAQMAIPAEPGMAWLADPPTEVIL